MPTNFVIAIVERVLGDKLIDPAMDRNRSPQCHRGA
jgi:hypothetical protein